MDRTEVAPPASSLRAHLVGNGLVVLALLGWWWGSQAWGRSVVPDPLAVGERVLRILFAPELAGHWVASLGRVLASCAIAMFVGGLLALAPRRLPWTEGIVHHLVKPFTTSFPAVAWTLLATIWFGISNTTVLFIQTMILVPYCLVNVSEGVRSLDTELLEMGRSFTRSGRRLFARVVLPQLVPYFVAALRMSYGVAWKMALIAEMFGARSGLGFLMVRAQANADATGVLAACFAIVVLFWAGDRFFIAPLARRYGA